MNMVECIVRKRDRGVLSAEEISELVRAYVSGVVPDYQMAAFLMAVVLRGMDESETVALTKAFIDSGETIDLSSIPGVKVDKHSTGGVGDKISLILAPLVAAAGVPVPMMAGRGLGHTGGTLDKLESIPGFTTQLSESAFRDQLASVGCAIIGQSERIVPADRKVYALRDVTGTVPSIPLICASILSKKKAEGTDGLVLDVKIGRGAFLPDRDETVKLAESLVRLGKGLGLKTVALLTEMDQPLGRTVGNRLEVLESIEVLRGQGPKEVRDLTLALGAEMLALAGKIRSPAEGLSLLAGLLDSGAAWKKFLEMVRSQKGVVSFVEHPDRWQKAKREIPVPSPTDGWVAGIDSLVVGKLCVDLGAGRSRKEDAIDPAAGAVLLKKTGDRVEKGETLVVLHADRDIDAGEAVRRMQAAVAVSDRPAKAAPLIAGRIG
ncbi:MAG: thymidine phosphorylase [bacterium]|nr:thymidine phosphorylase [bacterium]